MYTPDGALVVVEEGVEGEEEEVAGRERLPRLGLADAGDEAGVGVLHLADGVDHLLVGQGDAGPCKRKKKIVKLEDGCFPKS